MIFRRPPKSRRLFPGFVRCSSWGMDVAKMAVMPQSEKDVRMLLEATAEMKEQHPQTPVITMSMGKMGVLSRMAGELFGSALTFGTVGQASAPGQIPVKELRKILEMLHTSKTKLNFILTTKFIYAKMTTTNKS
ncbi:MAG: type I 3-dehydroquinate dehydratase [Lachnospiraceae bacterium]